MLVSMKGTFSDFDVKCNAGKDAGNRYFHGFAAGYIGPKNIATIDASLSRSTLNRPKI